MTITDQLQFSVLTAPVAALDRRTLSQAWYSALYRSGASAPVRGKCALEASNGGAHGNANPRACAAAAGEREPAFAAVQTASRSQNERSAGVPMERRAPHSPLARRIERAFAHRNRPAAKNTFVIEGAHGRVHVLLQSRGPRLKLIAICPQRARAQVAAALAQARYTLALRGIDLDASARGNEQC